MQHADTEKESVVYQMFKLNWASWIFLAQSGGRAGREQCACVAVAVAVAAAARRWLSFSLTALRLPPRARKLELIPLISQRGV